MYALDDDYSENRAKEGGEQISEALQEAFKRRKKEEDLKLQALDECARKGNQTSEGTATSTTSSTGTIAATGSKNDDACTWKPLMSFLVTPEEPEGQASLGFHLSTCSQACKQKIDDCNNVKDCRFAMNIYKSERYPNVTNTGSRGGFFDVYYVRDVHSCIERHCMTDQSLAYFGADDAEKLGKLIRAEIGCSNPDLDPGDSTDDRFPYYNVRDSSGICNQGFKCKSGENFNGNLVACDFNYDCADGSDEDQAICQLLSQDPVFKQAVKAKASTNWYDDIGLSEAEKESYAAMDALLGAFTTPVLGSGAKALLAIFIIATIAGIAFLIYSRKIESKKFDATDSAEGAVPYWAKTEKRRSIAKVWNIIWEFKATPVIAFSFYAMILTSVGTLNSQQLENSCLQDLSIPHIWDTSQCDNITTPEDGCRKYDKKNPIHLGTTNFCETELRGNKKTNLLKYMKNTSIRTDPTQLECRCDNIAERKADAKKYALPLSLLSSFGLFALVVSVLATPGVVSHRFGTLDYFVAVSNSKRDIWYTVILCLNMMILASAVVALIYLIELKRREIAGTAEKPNGNPNQINEEQYKTAYTQIVTDCLLQMMAYTDLWARIPPSNALAYFKDHFEPQSSREDVNKNIPKTIGAMDGSWSWFMTAEDTLEIAEDGFLFYYFSMHLPTLIDSTGKAHTLIRTVKTTASSKEQQQEEGAATIAAGSTGAGAVHEAYIAQRLSPQYWKGGVTFKPAAEAKRKYSTGIGIGEERDNDTTNTNNTTVQETVVNGAYNDGPGDANDNDQARTQEIAGLNAKIAELQTELQAARTSSGGPGYLDVSKGNIDGGDGGSASEDVEALRLTLTSKNDELSEKLRQVSEQYRRAKADLEAAAQATNVDPAEVKQLKAANAQLTARLRQADAAAAAAASSDAAQSNSPSNEVPTPQQQPASIVQQHAAAAPPASKPAAEPAPPSPPARSVDNDRKACAGCSKEIVGNLIAFGGKQYHPGCMVCETCSETLAETFHEEQGGFYCKECYINAFAPKCSVCTNAVEGKAVMLDEKMYCPQCFSTFTNATTAPIPAEPESDHGVASPPPRPATTTAPNRRQTVWTEASTAPEREEVSNIDLYGTVEPLADPHDAGVNHDDIPFQSGPPPGNPAEQCSYRPNGGCRAAQTTTPGAYCKNHSCACGEPKRSRAKQCPGCGASSKASKLGKKAQAAVGKQDAARCPNCKAKMAFCACNMRRDSASQPRRMSSGGAGGGNRVRRLSSEGGQAPGTIPERHSSA